MARSDPIIIIVILLIFSSISAVIAGGSWFLSKEEQSVITDEKDAIDINDNDFDYDYDYDYDSNDSTEKFRYVKILRDKSQMGAAGVPGMVNHHINLMEVEVISDGVNVSLNAPVTASSTHADLSPMNLTDGNLSSMAHTETDDIEWFLIDLGAEYPIDKIEVINRSDNDSASRTRGIKIQLSKSADMSDPKESNFVSVAQAVQATPKITWVPEEGPGLTAS